MMLQAFYENLLFVYALILSWTAAAFLHMLAFFLHNFILRVMSRSLRQRALSSGLPAGPALHPPGRLPRIPGCFRSLFPLRRGRGTFIAAAAPCPPRQKDSGAGGRMLKTP